MGRQCPTPFSSVTQPTSFLVNYRESLLMGEWDLRAPFHEKEVSLGRGFYKLIGDWPVKIPLSHDIIIRPSRISPSTGGN